MKFSIVVPIYNVEKYLERCIKSLINQTYKNIEIILVDDGSPDECPKICDYYATVDDRIKVCHKKNGGLSDARNYGIDLSTGDYIFLVDSDDTVNLDMCEKIAKIIEETNADMVSFNFDYVYIDNNDEHISKNQNLGTYKIYNSRDAYVNLIYGKEFYVMAWSRVYKSSILKEIKFPIGVLSEDFATAHKFFDVSDKVVYYDKNLYNYYLRNDSIMGSIKDNHIIDIYNISNDVFEYQIKNFFEHEKKIYSLYYNNIMKVYYLISNLKTKNERISKIQNECKLTLLNAKISKVQFKTKIALFLFKYFRFLFKIVMKKMIKLR